MALFCEFPSNPLLRSPDLLRIASLAQRYHFAVVVDETIGNFVNVSTLQYADIIVSSLTKVFSGDCNVMGGSLVLNPNGRYHSGIQLSMKSTFEDLYWTEDCIFMERNSRDFLHRVSRVNSNAEAVCQVLLSSPKGKHFSFLKRS